MVNLHLHSAVSTAKQSILAIPSHINNTLSKNTTAVDIAEVDDVVSQDGDRSSTPTSRAKQFFNFDILLACLAATIPMVLLSAATLYIVLHYRIDDTYCRLQELCPQLNQTRNGVYLVDFSATTLTTIASWSSSISLTLTAVLMFLFSYPIAAHLIRSSQATKYTELPTPYQLNLLIGSLGASLLTIWQFVVYTATWGKKRGSTVTPLAASVSMLFFTIALSTFIQLADTWLHVATDSVSLLLINGTTGTLPTVSRGMAPWCVDRDPFKTNCDFFCGIDCSFHTRNASTVYQTIAGISPVHKVYTTGSKPTLAVLGPATTDPDQDHTASTYAVATTCRPITKYCNLTDPSQQDPPNGAGKPAGSVPLPFNCTKYAANTSFTGDTNTAWQLALDPDSLSTRETQFSGTKDAFFNPFTWNIAATVDMTSANDQDTDALNVYTEDFAYSQILGLAQALIISCNTTMYDTTYAMLNGSIANVKMNASNASIAAIVAEPWIRWDRANPQLQQAWQLAYANAKNAQEYSDNFATRVSQLAVAYIAGQTAPRPALAAQVRSTKIVAEVPKGPLYTLFAANLLFAVVGMVLSVLAWMSCDSDVREVQSRLSVPGLVAELFEKPYSNKSVKGEKEMFRESEGLGHSRIFIGKVREGGYGYEVWH